MRSYQIAAIILLRYIDGIEISESQYPYYDLLVTDKTTGLKFGIEVKFSNFERTQEYQSYIQTLSDIDLNDENNRIPILIMAVNEREVVLDMLLSLREGKLSHTILKDTLDSYLYLDKSSRGFITRLYEGTIEKRLYLSIYIKISVYSANYSACKYTPKYCYRYT